MSLGCFIGSKHFQCATRRSIPSSSAAARVDQSFRIFPCVACGKQTIICRHCDHGNIYCSSTCAQLRRKQSLCRARKRHQQTFSGRVAHAQRQERYRQRQRSASQKVTDHGSTAARECGSVKETTSAEVRDSKNSTYGRALAGEIRCHFCQRVCGPFARLEYWRNGRHFSKLRRLNAYHPRDRS